jgi:carboxylate-amine ligase
MLTIGVEEEFYVVDDTTWQLAEGGLPALARLIEEPGTDGDGSHYDHEFQLAIVETRTSVCSDLDQLRKDLSTRRRVLLDASAEDGLTIMSAGTHPTADWRAAAITDSPRYDVVAQHFREVVRRRATCGCHVHIGIDDPDLAVRVLSRVRPWLPALLALSASSPFYEGHDTGFHSSRYLLWGAFPVAGPPGSFHSYRDYLDRVEQLRLTGAIHELRDIYWDVRLGTSYPTLEFRIADAGTRVSDTLLQAALCRALVLTAIREIDAGVAAPEPGVEVLRAASWRAARDGINGQPISTDALVAYVRAALVDLGDEDTVDDLLATVAADGTSAQRQLRAYDRTGQVGDALQVLIAETAALP